MADPIKIGGRPGLTPKRWNGFPDRQQHLLQQVVAIVTRRETIYDMMQNRAVSARPVGKPLFLFGNMHEFSVI